MRISKWYRLQNRKTGKIFDPIESIVLYVLIVMVFPVVSFSAMQYTTEFNAVYGTTGGFDYQPELG
ncbi:hypothetical protein ACFLZM_05610, partial [Thermodesulfobacteriota bacterium]